MAAIGSAEAPGGKSPDAATPGAPAARLPTEDAPPTRVVIKAAEAEADTFYVAGEAPPGSRLRVYANDALVGEATANTDGSWLMEAARAVPVGKVVVRADTVNADPPGAPQAAGSAGPDAQGQRAEQPFQRYPDGVVLEPSASVGGSASEIEANLPPPAYIIIRRGDNLWRLSRRNYGRGIRYGTIFAANRDQIRSPHRIYPGQVFVMPKRDASWEAATN